MAIGAANGGSFYAGFLMARAARIAKYGGGPQLTPTTDAPMRVEKSSCIGSAGFSPCSRNHEVQHESGRIAPAAAATS
jgi:hypothetical protein